MEPSKHPKFITPFIQEFGLAYLILLCMKGI